MEVEVEVEIERTMQAPTQVAILLATLPRVLPAELLRMLRETQRAVGVQSQVPVCGCRLCLRHVGAKAGTVPRSALRRTCPGHRRNEQRGTVPVFAVMSRACQSASSAQSAESVDGPLRI